MWMKIAQLFSPPLVEDHSYPSKNWTIIIQCHAITINEWICKIGFGRTEKNYIKQQLNQTFQCQVGMAHALATGWKRAAALSWHESQQTAHSCQNFGAMSAQFTSSVSLDPLKVSNGESDSFHSGSEFSLKNLLCSWITFFRTSVAHPSSLARLKRENNARDTRWDNESYVQSDLYTNSECLRRDSLNNVIHSDESE